LTPELEAHHMVEHGPFIQGSLAYTQLTSGPHMVAISARPPEKYLRILFKKVPFLGGRSFS